MQVFEEIEKCRNDFVYFVEKYVKITHYAKGLINAKLYDFQKKLINYYENKNYVIVKKFRQGGFTTMSALYGLWKSMFFLDQRFLFVSKSDREAISLGKVVRSAVNNLPDQFKPFITKQNDHEITFGCTGSRMDFRSPLACRSRSCTHLIIDEAAFISNMEEHWKAMYPVIQTGGKCFVVSTVNGIGNWYEETYTRALNRTNEFFVFDCSWKEHPDFNNPEFEKKTRANLGEKAWLQEMEGCFIGSQPTEDDLFRNKLRNIVNNQKLSRQEVAKRITVEILSCDEIE